MDELGQDIIIDELAQKSAQKKVATGYKNDGLALEPIEYEEEEMDCDEELGIMEASVTRLSALESNGTLDARSRHCITFG